MRIGHYGAPCAPLKDCIKQDAPHPGCPFQSLSRLPPSSKGGFSTRIITALCISAQALSLSADDRRLARAFAQIADQPRLFIAQCAFR